MIELTPAQLEMAARIRSLCVFGSEDEEALCASRKWVEANPTEAVAVFTASGFSHGMEAAAKWHDRQEKWAFESNLFDTGHFHWLAAKALRALAPSPGDTHDAEVAEDAARWRALMSSERIRVMGCAGMGGKDRPPSATGHYHIGVEFWSLHEAKTTPHDIEWFEQYIDLMRRKPT